MMHALLLYSLDLVKDTDITEVIATGYDQKSCLPLNFELCHLTEGCFVRLKRAVTL